MVSGSRPVVPCESSVSLNEVLPRYVGILRQVGLAYDHIIRGRPVNDLPLALDRNVAILDCVSLLC